MTTPRHDFDIEATERRILSAPQCIGLIRSREHWAIAAPLMKGEQWLWPTEAIQLVMQAPFELRDESRLPGNLGWLEKYGMRTITTYIKIAGAWRRVCRRDLAGQVQTGRDYKSGQECSDSIVYGAILRPSEFVIIDALTDG